MKRPDLNLLTGLVLAIILLGIISVLTVIVNANTYRDLAFDFQRQYMTQMLASEINAILTEDAENLRRMGLSIQKEEHFRRAYASGDRGMLENALAVQFQRAPVTSNQVDAVAIYAYDADYTLLGMRLRDAGAGTVPDRICPDLITKARIREGARRLKPLHELCLYQGAPYLAAIVPVGGLVPTGYLQIVDNPLQVLSRVDVRLNMPVQIQSADGSLLYSSPDWAQGRERHNVESGYVLSTDDSRSALGFVTSRNADTLLIRIGQTNRRLLVTVVLVLLATVVLALLLVNYSVFRPLQSLRERVRREWRGESGSAVAAARGDGPVSFHALGELYDTLHDLAIRDPLTGTYNRALLEDRLTQVIAAQRRTPGHAAVLLLDLVRFKYVNDILGHHVGDQLLKDIVHRIDDVLRESDTLARLGGDEFVIVLPDTDREQACQVANKILLSMKQQFEVRDHKIFASVTIGIALLPEHGLDVDTLLRNADYAMYSAKALKQGYAVYDPSTTENIDLARMTLDNVLNQNIERNALFLVYQPVLEITTGQISYLEALLRWRRPDDRIVMPDAFIRAAEQSGLIRQLSEWVIHTACLELHDLQQRYPGMRTGINLSMHNLHDFNLKDRILDALQKFHLKPQSLLLEITETGVMQDPEQVIELLNQLSALGLHLSIDDFGTGHSSLVYLKRLPVHTLKVDKSFVTDMAADGESASIVNATIDLAHNLGLTVTAEGVETEAVYQRLRGMGCDFYQGYFGGRPMRMDELLDWLETRDLV